MIALAIMSAFEDFVNDPAGVLPDDAMNPDPQELDDSDLDDPALAYLEDAALPDPDRGCILAVIDDAIPFAHERLTLPGGVDHQVGQPQVGVHQAEPVWCGAEFGDPLGHRRQRPFDDIVIGRAQPGCGAPVAPAARVNPSGRVHDSACSCITAVSSPSAQNPTDSGGASSAVHPGTKLTASTCRARSPTVAVTTCSPDLAVTNCGVRTDVCWRSAAIQASSDSMAGSE